jgi:4-hydroxy-tetrahydrodipicolinate synthase
MSARPLLLRGVIPNLITPFTPDGDVAWEVIEREVTYLDQSGVDGIVVGGLMSETSGSTPEELFRICEGARRFTRKPLLGSIQPDSEPEALELLEAVLSAGAEAVFVAQPHYLFQPDPASLIPMFERLRATTQTPILLANLLSSAPIDLPTLTEVINAEVVDGVLEACGNAHLLTDLLRLRLPVPVFSGLEDLQFVALMLGATGISSALAAVFPVECVELYRQCQNGDYDQARKIHERLLRVWRVLEHPSEQLSRLRWAFAVQGRDVGSARSPYGAITPASSLAVAAALNREGLASSVM